MAEGLEDAGVVRALDSLEGKIDTLSTEVHELDQKVDILSDTKVSRTEFNAYRELQQVVIREGNATRRSNIRWAVTTIIAVLMLLLTAVSLIITSRPDVIVETARALGG